MIELRASYQWLTDKGKPQMVLLSNLFFYFWLSGIFSFLTVSSPTSAVMVVAWKRHLVVWITFCLGLTVFYRCHWDMVAFQFPQLVFSSGHLSLLTLVSWLMFMCPAFQSLLSRSKNVDVYFTEPDDDFWAFEPKGGNQENQIAPMEMCCVPLQLLTYVA